MKLVLQFCGPFAVSITISQLLLKWIYPSTLIKLTELTGTLSCFAIYSPNPCEIDVTFEQYFSMGFISSTLADVFSGWVLDLSHPIRVRPNSEIMKIRAHIEVVSVILIATPIALRIY